MANQTAQSSRKGTFTDYVTDRAARGLIRFAKAMPFRWRVPFMGWVMSRIVGHLAPYHRKARAHLALIYPDKTPQEIRRMATACLDNVGRSLIENFSTLEFRDNMKDTPLEGDGVAALKEAAASGRAIILQSGHFGNYEAVRAVMYAHGIVPGGIYRVMNNPYFHEHYVQTMLAYGGPAFARGMQGMRGVMRHLKSGGQLIILNDQYDFGGTVLEFMGRPAKTPLSPAELALRFDALVVPFFGIRQPDGLTFKCVVQAPIPHSDPETMTQEMNDRISEQVRAHPEQWFWIARRWRPY